jgi:hypothetical protein
MPWRRMGEWRYSSAILDLSIRWRWVVSFTTRQPYPQYSLDTTLVEPQSRSGRCREEKNLNHTGNRTPPVQSLARRCTDRDILIPASFNKLIYLRSWALPEKLPIVQPLRNFPAFYGTRRFITVFTRALHWSLSWARSIQSIPSHPISLRKDYIKKN